MTKKKLTDPSKLSDDTERMSIPDETDRTQEFAVPSFRKSKAGEKVACLLVVDGDFLGEIYPIEKDIVTIGRSKKCDIPIPDSSISRVHIDIRKTNNGFVLHDLKSTNGVTVNGLAVTSKPLDVGDKIQLGRIVLRFDFEDPMDQSYHRKLRSLAIRDSLTKIFNKGHFLEVLAKELSFAARSEMLLSLVVFDIDDFKKINDSYGHTVGDQVLRTIAELLNGEVRGYDCFARFGGEEFVFLLREITPLNTLHFCERIRKIIESHLFLVEKVQVTITISLGFAYADANHRYKTGEEFLATADKFLYDAKHEGKNRVSHQPFSSGK